MHIIDLTLELPERAMPVRTVKRKTPPQSAEAPAAKRNSLQDLLERVDQALEKAGLQMPPAEKRALKLVKPRPVRRRVLQRPRRVPPLEDGPGLDISGYKPDNTIYVEVDTPWE
jgi:hypothetical protein